MTAGEADEEARQSEGALDPTAQSRAQKLGRTVYCMLKLEEAFDARATLYAAPQTAYSRAVRLPES